MNAQQPSRTSPARVVVSYLIATGPAGDGAWRWRFTTTLALIGPGSVPFGLGMFAIQNHMLRVDYLIPWGVFPAFATGAAVVLARFRPVEAWLLVMASLAATMSAATVDGSQPWPLTTANLFALYLVLFALGRDRRFWVGILAWLSYLFIGANALQYGPTPDLSAAVNPNPASDNLALGAVLGAFAFLIGLTVRIWRQGRARLAEKEEVAETERHRRRLLEERTRIARELHDIVAHHMSVIAVQASTAEYRLAGLDGEAKAEFRSIGDQARESLAEMRRLLGVLRSEDEAGAREPQPGPEALRGLVESVNRAGTPVALDVVELPEELPETVALTVFRVVQEALSNVVRHAPGASTSVVVAAEESAVVTVAVSNGPPPGSAVAAVPRGSGLGLVGMGERVALEGGTLETGPTAEGGFRVFAALPVETRSTAEETP